MRSALGALQSIDVKRDSSGRPRSAVRMVIGKAISAPLNGSVRRSGVTENMQKKTPQEKKQLSYEKDRRNCYGESPHGARKSIPKRKRLRNQANRKYQEQQLAITSLKLDDDLAEQIESRIHQKAPKVWSKVADAPLKKIIEHKQQRRRRLEKQGGRRGAKKKLEDKS